MTPSTSKRSWVGVAAFGVAVIVMPAAIGVAVAARDGSGPSADRLAVVDAGTTQADDGWDDAPFHAASDNEGRVAGYVKANPAEFDKFGSQPVYARRDGGGGVVGYLTDFGYVDAVSYESPGFDLDQARAAFRAKLEADGRKADPDFDLDRAQQDVVNQDFESRGVTPPTTSRP